MLVKNDNNPKGYKDYKETYDDTGQWKKVEYTDENGNKVKKEVNVLGQEVVYYNVPIKENISKKKEIKLDEALLDDWKTKPKKNIDLDEALLDDWSFDDNQQETKKEQRYDWESTPENEIDIYHLTENDFFKMDWRRKLFVLYRLLLNISSFLSDIKEVSKENEKQYK